MIRVLRQGVLLPMMVSETTACHLWQTLLGTLCLILKVEQKENPIFLTGERCSVKPEKTWVN
jgi:hypothetical protein